MKKLNNRGFTLVELLATIVILGIISVISIVSIDKMLDHSREVECDSILQNITIAAKEYVSDKRYEYSGAEYAKITVSDLIYDNYLTGVMKNPFNNEELDEETENIWVIVELNDDYTAGVVQIFNSNDLENAKIIKCHVDAAEAEKAVLFPG